MLMIDCVNTLCIGYSVMVNANNYYVNFKWGNVYVYLSNCLSVRVIL